MSTPLVPRVPPLLERVFKERIGDDGLKEGLVWQRRRAVRANHPPHPARPHRVGRSRSPAAMTATKRVVAETGDGRRPSPSPVCLQPRGAAASSSRGPLAPSRRAHRSHPGARRTTGVCAADTLSRLRTLSGSARACPQPCRTGMLLVPAFASGTGTVMVRTPSLYSAVASSPLAPAGSRTERAKTP